MAISPLTWKPPTHPSLTAGVNLPFERQNRHTLAALLCTNQNLDFLAINSLWETMNYFTHVETPVKEVIYARHTKIIVIDLNSIDICKHRSSHFVNFLCNWTFVQSFEIITLCFLRIMRWYLYVAFRHGVNSHRSDPPTQ